jgi:hypothetical protein
MDIVYVNFVNCGNICTLLLLRENEAQRWGATWTVAERTFAKIEGVE